MVAAAYNAYAYACRGSDCVRTKFFFESVYLCFRVNLYDFPHNKLFKVDTSEFIMRLKKVSDVIGLRVYTDGGDLFGEIEEVNLVENKIDGWRIRVGGSVISLLGGARGVIIPHQFIKAIGDVCIVSKSALPSSEGMATIPEDL